MWSDVLWAKRLVENAEQLYDTFDISLDKEEAKVFRQYRIIDDLK